MHCQFDDSFNYDELVALNISKQNLTRLFANPKIHNEVDPKKHKFSIKLCTNEVIKTHFLDCLWMTFDIPPHNNLQVPIYFLTKLYVDFFKGVKVNHWSRKSNMGLGGGAPQDRP